MWVENQIIKRTLLNEFDYPIMTTIQRYILEAIIVDGGYKEARKYMQDRFPLHHKNQVVS